MKRCINFSLITIFLFLSRLSDAQSPTWSEDVAEIIYANCVSCHHEGAVAPFSLMTYDEAIEWGIDIQHQVSDRHMPPWPADPSYRHFKDEAVLSDEEIQKIVDWVDADMPSGDLAEAPVPPAFPDGGSMLPVIHHTVAIEPYTLQYDEDEYRWFTVENPFEETIYINAIEVIPGIKEHVHHCDISWDLSGISKAFDDEDPLPGYNEETGYPNYDYYMNAWMAGGNLIRYPENWGIEVPPGAVFVLEIHYGPGAIGETDSTIVNFEFVTDPGDVRPVYASWLLSGPDGGPLVIPPDEISWFEQEYEMTNKKSVITICPHMHLLGKSYKVWFEEDGDSIPLISIPEWQFHWQKYYTFQKVQVIESDAVIKGIASYDNTMFNIYNPNYPPQTVYQGPTTSDEMMLTYFLWTNYKAGDEDMYLDSTIIPNGVNTPITKDLSVYPNPAGEHLYVNTAQLKGEILGLQIFNSLGIEVIVERDPITNETWGIDVHGLTPGVYYLEFRVEGGFYASSFIKL